MNNQALRLHKVLQLCKAYFAITTGSSLGFQKFAQVGVVSLWVSKISFKTGFSGLSLGLSFHPCSQHLYFFSSLIVCKRFRKKKIVSGW